MSTFARIRRGHLTRNAILIVALTLIAVALAASVNGAPSTGLVSCGPGSNPAPIFAEVDLPDGASIFKHFPNFGITPEISNPNGPLHRGPLHVTIFKGQVCGIPALGPVLQPGISRQAVFTNVVRITKSDGDAWYFSDVDLTTFVS
jgi:hypothetical protein